MEFINQILGQIGYIDLGLIVLGVLALVFGLNGKAPRRIFHLLFVIASIPVAYMAFNLYKDQILGAINGIDAVKGILDTLADSPVGSTLAPMIPSIEGALVFYVIGILALIFVPFVGDIIVKLFTIKARKGTAVRTLGITNLLSVAIAWTFILLPVILLTPIATKVPDIMNLVTSLSGDNGSGDEGGSSKTPTAFVLTSDEQNPDNGNDEGELGIIDVICSELQKSKYLEFTSTKGVEIVEKTMTKILGKDKGENWEWHFLSYEKTDKDGNVTLVPILGSITSLVDTFTGSEAMMEVIGSLTNGGDPVEALASMSKEDLAGVLTGLAENKDLITDVIGGLMGGEGEGGEADPVVGMLTTVLDNINEENAESVANVVSFALPMVSGDTQPEELIGSIFTQDKEDVKQLLSDVKSCSEILNAVVPEGEDNPIAELTEKLDDETINAVGEIVGAIKVEEGKDPEFVMPESEEDKEALISTIADSIDNVSALTGMMGEGTLYDMCEKDDSGNPEILNTAQSMVGEGEGKISQEQYNKLADMFKQKVETPSEPGEGGNQNPKE